MRPALQTGLVKPSLVTELRGERCVEAAGAGAPVARAVTDASRTPLLAMRGVGKRFEGGPEVLRGIDLELPPGELVSFIGPSGCGKSTLLRLVAGLSAVTSGMLELAEGMRRDGSEIAFVFQDATLLPWQTVLGNVALPLKLARLPKPERLAKAREYIELVGLSHAADQFPRQLSGGMKMRVSVARALAVDPTLLLLDEPFGALDEMTRDALNEELLRLRELAGWSALFVTHSVAEAVYLSTRVVVLAPNPGRIARVVEVPFDYPRPPDIRQSSAFVELVVEVSRTLRNAQPRQAP